jgi:hypothetical protein
LRFRLDELRSLLPEVTERVWEGLTRAWPSSPTCPAASWEGFCSARGFDPRFEDFLEPELCLGFDFDELLRWERLPDCLLLDRELDFFFVAISVLR